MATVTSSAPALLEPTREQDAALEELALHYEQVRVCRCSASRQPGLFQAHCLNGGALAAVVTVDPSGARRRLS